MPRKKKTEEPKEIIKPEINGVEEKIIEIMPEIVVGAKEDGKTDIKKKGRKAKEIIAEIAAPVIPVVSEEAEIAVISKEEKIRELKEKAKKLAEGIEEVNISELKEKIAKKKDLLVPLEDYMKTSTYLGTRVITPNMRKYVYKRRADGLAVLNTNLIDDKLREVIDFIIKFDAKDTIVTCKREAGWKAVNLFSELTGIKVFTKKYPAGIITNINLPGFFEPELVIVCDPWLDKNALNDAATTNKRIVALCDTNNFTMHADKIIPCNNKGNKSLGLVFYIITREYMKAKKINKQLPELSEFIGEKI